MVFPYRVSCNRQHMLQIFRQFSFCVAIVKLLQTLSLIECFPLNYCSAGLTELYPIFIHCETKPYMNTLPNYTLSQNITKVSFHLELSHNSSCSWYTYPQMPLLFRAVIIICAGALEKSSKKFFPLECPNCLTVPKLSHSAHSLSLYKERN